MNRFYQPIAATACVATFALAGCSDAERTPDGARFSESVTGVPGVVLIDDMEDGSQYILSDDGNVGLWYIYNDASLNAVQEPAVGFPMYQIAEKDGSPIAGAAWPQRPCGGGAEAPFFAGEPPEECEFVARTWGTGQRGWGAGVGVDLNGEGGAKNPVNASAYGGIGFFVIGDVRGGSMRVNVQDVRTTPESAAAADRRQIRRCTGALDSRCNDHFGTVIEVTPTWKWVEIPFSCMTPGGWGFPGMGEPFLSSAVVGVQFQISGADPADTGVATPEMVIEPFDFAIDNLSFLDASRVGACPVAPRPTP